VDLDVSMKLVSAPFLVTLVALLLVSGGVGQAADFGCAGGDARCLVAAIRGANGSPGLSTIFLAEGTYTLTAVDNDTDGPNGLPSIVAFVDIRAPGGAQRTIIERAPGAPDFRFFHVSPLGTLRLAGVTLRGGVHRASGPSPDPLATALGGAIFVDRGRLGLGDVRLTDNVADGAFAAHGGAIFSNAGTVAVFRSTIANNRVTGGLDDVGGGLAAAGGSLTITESTIADNQVDARGAEGGGIGDVSALTPLSPPAERTVVNVVNSTIARNSVAGHVVAGGGVRVSRAGQWTIESSTIAGNTAGGLAGGGGGVSVAGSLTLRNTIVAQNSGSSDSPDCAGSITSLDHNLIEELAGCAVTLQPHDRTGAGRLAIYTDDGVPGHGHWPLLPDSQAIDGGDETTCPPADQLGRPRRGRCDIGAAEFAPEPDSLSTFVTGFYRYVLGREPDPPETAGWLSFLRAEPTVGRVRGMTHAFFDGPEYRGRPFKRPRHVSALYRAILGRDGDPGGLNGWVSFLTGRDVSTLDLFLDSPEFHTVVPDCKDVPAVSALIVRLYEQALRRTPTPNEVSSWLFTFSTNCSIRSGVVAILTLPEYVDVPRTVAEHVEVLYRALLGRSPGAEEVAYWVDYLTPPLVEDQFIDSPEFAARWQQLTRP
jgi:hypothetical protein